MKNQKFKSILYASVFYFIIALSFLLIFFSLMSLFYDFPYWFIKILDFPRIQYFIVGLVLLVLFYFLNRKWDFSSFLLITGILIALTIHGTRLLPYIVGEKTVPDAEFTSEEKSLGILLANVLIKNKETIRIKKIINEANPDLILVMEVNKWWISELQELKNKYPYFIEYPLDNAYGIALYSKLKFEKHEIRFLNGDDVPSIHTRLLMPSGKEIQLHWMHPVPPVPSNKYPDNVGKTEVALMKVAKMVARDSLPAIVAGDFNDVSWSQTTRMFGSEANLNDVRIGRGFFNSFDAGSFYLRWPLDHIFVTAEFSLVTLERLPKFGSDHFPLYAEFVLSK